MCQLYETLFWDRKSQILNSSAPLREMFGYLLGTSLVTPLVMSVMQSVAYLQKEKEKSHETASLHYAILFYFWHMVPYRRQLIIRNTGKMTARCLCSELTLNHR